MAGCSSYEIADTPASAESVSSPIPNPFEADAAAAMVAAVSHGLSDTDTEESGICEPLLYSGGEMAVSYTVSADGKAENTGFLLFLNGIPQPYRIDSEMTYLDSLRLPGSNEEFPFTFRFTPVTGKKGETLILTVASVFYPDFKPDMAETSSYGSYHAILPYQCEIQMQADPEQADTPRTTPLISDLSLITQKATKSF